MTQGFWACFIYRITHAGYCRFKNPIWKKPFHFISVVLQKIIEILTGISLPAECEVGKGLYIGHFGHLIINPRVKIGDNCNLSQGVTLGIKQRGKHAGSPLIGNRVYIGPNAIIIGKIEVGDDAAIGAGAVVTRSVSPRAVVAGNPAKIISMQGSFEMVRYDGMENDPERMASLVLREANDRNGDSL